MSTHLKSFTNKIKFLYLSKNRTRHLTVFEMRDHIMNLLSGQNGVTLSLCKHFL